MARLTSLSGARLLGAGLAGAARGLAWPLGAWHGARLRAELSTQAAPVYRLATAHGPLAFRCASAEAVKAAARFVHDEPETVWWIDQVVQPGECVWDIGANVGLYALYAGLRLGAGGTVVAFEPGADNFAALCRNVASNPMPAAVQTLCAALADETRAASLHMTSLEAGRAAHVFGHASEAESTEARPHVQSALGFTADAIAALFALRRPDHVKIDVDSIEEKILRGGSGVFAGARSLIVELNVEGSAAHKAGLRSAIEELGFVEHADTTARHPDRRNRLFVRP